MMDVDGEKLSQNLLDALQLKSSCESVPDQR